jgi:hypothetical protein
MTDTTASQPPSFESWAILELLGHRQRVGLVREVEMFGGRMLRIDIPTDGGDITEFYGSSSLYAMRPVSEEVARDIMKRSGDPRPVRPAEYREPQAITHCHDEYDEGELSF